MPTEAATDTVPAESSTPPESPTREHTPNATQTTTSTPEPTETTSPTDTVPVEQPALLESVQAISSDTSVVVLDANGQPLPLVTQEAANVIAISDPMWCPAGVPPGGAGCTSSYTSLALLLSDLSAMNSGTGVGANGTIWIESSYDSSVNDPLSTDFTLNGSTLTTWANFSLTLQGGWGGSGNSIFSVPISILNWNNNVTVNNITVNNAAGTGLTIDTSQDVAINNSTFSNNNNTGSSFPIDGHGLDIQRARNVTINNSTFSGNERHGAFINSSTSTILNSTFSGNTQNGASISANNDVAISNSTFSGNGGDGAFIDSLDATITNSTFSGNSGVGATIWLANNVSITNSTFSGNGEDGVYMPSYNITINDSTFSSNGGNGATIYYENVTIANSTFSNNNNVGLSLNGGSLSSTPGVATLICNHFQNNGQDENFTSVIALVRVSCEIIPKPLPQFVIVFPADQDFVEFSLDCTHYSSFLVWLPNGDKVVISCVLSGTARISRLDNTTLPKDLPAGFEYASAFKVDIFQNGVPLPAITTSGSILASFASRHDDPRYSIMVWDEKINDWRILNAYQIDPNGAPVVFPLDPADPQDERRILSGVRLITTYDPDREEVTTNFPGTFVLVQQ